VLCTLGAVAGAGILIYSMVAGGGAAAQVLTDVGRFKVGSELGMERAGFSGRAMLMIFATAGVAEWDSLSSCPQSLEVEARLGHFTPIIVDERTEPDAPSVLRVREDIQVAQRQRAGNSV
jgi:hypothetical protein